MFADAAALVSMAEQVPAGFDLNRPVAIQWAPHPKDCLTVRLQGGSLEGGSVETAKCGSASAEFILRDGLEGQILWAENPDYCLTVLNHGTLKFQLCSKMSEAQGQFTFQDGHIQVKVDTSQCIAVDSHSTDSNGNHKVAVQDCHAWDGDSLFPPARENFKFSVDWFAAPTTTVLNTTETNTTTTTVMTTTASPQHLPKKVLLKSTHGKYLVAELGGSIFANRPWADAWEKFDVVDLGEGAVALKTVHGYFVTVNYLGMISASAREPNLDSHLYPEHVKDGTVAIKSAYGKYVSVQPSGIVTGSSGGHGSWEEFEVVDIASTWPDHVAIKASPRRYVRARPTGMVEAGGRWPLDAWESYYVFHHGVGVVSLRCDHGEWITAESDGLIHARASPTSTPALLTVEHLPDGNFTMKTEAGMYLAVEANRTLTATRGHFPGDAGKFQVVMIY